MPTPASRSAISAASALVFTKTRVVVPASARRMRASASSRKASGTMTALCLMWSVERAAPSTCSSTGDFIRPVATRRICSGMVAENSAVWALGGVAARIFSTSSMKPMRSISSASSSTTKSTLPSCRLPRSMWSMTRPGVPTMTVAPPCSALSCGGYGAPP